MFQLQSQKYVLKSYIELYKAKESIHSRSCKNLKLGFMLIFHIFPYLCIKQWAVSHAWVKVKICIGALSNPI